jgi:hypothetical protein
MAFLLSGFGFVIDNARSFRICVTNFNATKNCILPVIICDAVMACARHEFVREWDRPASADPAVMFDQDRSAKNFDEATARLRANIAKPAAFVNAIIPVERGDHGQIYRRRLRQSRRQL